VPHTGDPPRVEATHQRLLKDRFVVRPPDRHVGTLSIRSKSWQRANRRWDQCRKSLGWHTWTRCRYGGGRRSGTDGGGLLVQRQAPFELR